MEHLWQMKDAQVWQCDTRLSDGSAVLPRILTSVAGSHEAIDSSALYLRSTRSMDQQLGC